MGLLELFILVLGLAIVAVLLRGVYIALQARKGQLRMQLEKNVPEYDPDSLTLSELPNGGARLVERSFAQVVKQNSDFAKQEKKSGRGIPVLMDSVDDEAERPSTIASARQAARQKHVMGRDSQAAASKAQQPVVKEAPAPVAPPAPVEQDDHFAVSGDVDDYDDPIANHVFADEAGETGELARDSYAHDDLDDAVELGSDGGFSGDDIEDESESMVGSSGVDATAFDEEDEEAELDDTPDCDPANEDILEHDEDEFEDEDFEGEGQDQDIALDSSSLIGEAEASDDWQNSAADELEDDDIDSEPFDSVYVDDAPMNVASTSKEADEEVAYSNAAKDELEDELEDDFDETDGDYDEAEDLDDSSHAGHYEEDEEDEEQDSNEDDFNDDFEDDFDDEEYDEPRAMHSEEPSGPRSWLKWAGNKLSEMGGSSDEDKRVERSERAEPSIGESSFDDVMKPAPAAKPAKQKRSPAKPVQAESQQPEDEMEESSATQRPAHFDRSHQNQLDFALPDEQPVREQPKPAAAKPTPTTPEKKQETSPVQSEFSEVLVINVVAKPEREIEGTDLLQVLLGNGLIFGEMSIFHRHLDHNRESPVLFSVANLVNPGTFDLNQISSFTTKGLCFFLTLPNVATSMQAFDKMLETAQQVRVALDCDLKDDSRSVMTAQTIEHYRQRVREFDLRQLRQSK